jgi:hypothetical protein
MGKLFLSKAEAAKAPAIKGKDGRIFLLSILCVLVVLYAIVITVITGGYTAASAALMFIIYGLVGFKLLAKRNLFKWEYTLAMVFSIYSILANSILTIPYYLDLIWYDSWAATILLEPLIANVVFLVIAVISYDIAFRNAPFKSWTS